MRIRVLVLGGLGCAATIVGLLAFVKNSPAYDVKANYTKSEVMIPTRDGVKLFTIIYAPKNQSQRYPILMSRTAYGIAPYGPDNYATRIGPNNEFAKEGYIIVYQDARGKFKSEGEFIHHRPIVKGQINEATDTYDTIDWLIKNVPNNNGRAGQWGISWNGWEVSQGMIDAHPALKASSPQSPPQDQFLGDDHHSGGAFQLMYAFSWMSENARARHAPSDQPPGRFDYGTRDGYDFFLKLGAAANAANFFADVPTWNDYMVHGTYDDYWQSRNVPKDLVHINHPVLIVSAWFDAQDFWGPFRMYEAMTTNNPNNATYFIMGPWLHGGYSSMPGDALANLDFRSRTGEYFREEVELPFFNYYLKDEGTLKLPPVQAFETGRNAWRSLGRWPPPNTQAVNLYFGERSTLTMDAPKTEGAFDTYVSDPAAPVPFTAETRTTEGHMFMVEDQRFLAGRADVLVYQTEPLAKDLTIAGSIIANLNVSTTGTDADFVVKLIDVYPGKDTTYTPLDAATSGNMNGFQLLLAGDILRTKFRESFTTPKPMVPGAMTHIEFPLGDRYHTFLKGHRVMVQVQSSWFPMFDRNPQTFVDIYHAKAADYQAATQRVYRGVGGASFVSVNVLGPSR